MGDRTNHRPLRVEIAADDQMVRAAVWRRTIDAQRAFERNEAGRRPEIDLVAAFAEVELAQPERRKGLQVGCSRLVAGLVITDADLARQRDLRLHRRLDR